MGDRRASSRCFPREELKGGLRFQGPLAFFGRAHTPCAPFGGQGTLPALPFNYFTPGRRC